MLALYFILYKPVTKMLDQRSQKIKESLDQAERVQQESARAEDQVKAQIETARAEGRTIVGQATQLAEKVREEARAQARVDAEAIVARARSEVQRERDEAVEQLRREFAALTIVAAERVINKSLDAREHQRLIDDVLQNSKSFGKN